MAALTAIAPGVSFGSPSWIYRCRRSAGPHLLEDGVPRQLLRLGQTLVVVDVLELVGCWIDRLGHNAELRGGGLVALGLGGVGVLVDEVRHALDRAEVADVLGERHR